METCGDPRERTLPIEDTSGEIKLLASDKLKLTSRHVLIHRGEPLLEVRAVLSRPSKEGWSPRNSNLPLVIPRNKTVQTPPVNPCHADKNARCAYRKEAGQLQVNQTASWHDHSEVYLTMQCLPNRHACLVNWFI